MKRTLTLVATAAACCATWGQTTPGVVVYGIADAGVTRVTGMKGGTDNRVVSGIMDGSRFGIRGNEDLGSGLRAFFDIESRVEINNGTMSNRPPSGSAVPDRLSTATLLGLPGAFQPVVSAVAAQVGSTIGANLSNAAWDRQSYVGLATPVGAVLAGRQYTPAYEVSATFDTTQTQSSLSAAHVAAIPASIDIRVSNALSYRVQRGGFSGSVMYTLENTPATPRLKGFAAMYKTDGLAFGVGYNTRENELGEKSLTTSVIGVAYGIGPGTLCGLFSLVKDDHPTGLSGITALLSPLPPAGVGPANAALVQGAFTNALKQDGRLSNIGYRYTTGPSTVYVAYSSYDDRRPNNADVASYGAVYSYALSKQTDVNFAATHFRNAALAQAAPGGAGYTGGITAAAGVDSTSLALGMRYRF